MKFDITNFMTEKDHSSIDLGQGHRSRCLTLYHTMLTFNEPEKEVLKTSWEKEKMLVTSIFFFSKMFSILSEAEIVILPTFNLSSANASSLDRAKILFFW